MMITIETGRQPVLDDVNFQHFLKECGMSIIQDRHRMKSAVHEWVFDRYTNVLATYREQIEFRILSAMDCIRNLGASEALSYISKTTHVVSVTFDAGLLKVEYY